MHKFSTFLKCTAEIRQKDGFIVLSLKQYSYFAVKSYSLFQNADSVKYFLPLIRMAIILVLAAGIFQPVSAQIFRVGAGLCFSTGAPFNQNESGNPGFKLKTWIALDKRSTIHIVPTVTAYNRSILGFGLYSMKNYMYMGDLDGQVTVYHDRTLKIVTMAGANYTYLTSAIIVDPKYKDHLPPSVPQSEEDYAIGANLGAGLELRMGNQWDMNVAAKYLISKYSQFIISVEGVYYFKSRRKAYRR